MCAVAAPSLPEEFRPLSSWCSHSPLPPSPEEFTGEAAPEPLSKLLMGSNRRLGGGQEGAGVGSRSATAAERRAGAAQEVDDTAGGGSWKSTSAGTCRRGNCGGAASGQVEGASKEERRSPTVALRLPWTEAGGAATLVGRRWGGEDLDRKSVV